MNLRSVQFIRDEIAIVKAFSPDDAARLAKLTAELDEAKSRAKARAAVRAALPTATHVLLADGWAEVVRFEDGAVVVQVGEHRPARVSIRGILDAKRLTTESRPHGEVGTA